MQPARLRLGQLLLDAHILTSEQLEEVLARQKSDGRKLGVLLVENGLVTETLLTQILSQQLSVPWVSLYHIDFSRDLLSRVPRDVAEKYCLVPIYIRHVRGQGDTLYVAMDDPMQEEALRDCAASSGLPARAMIAAPSDIRRALRLCYGTPEEILAASIPAELASRVALSVPAEPRSRMVASAGGGSSGPAVASVSTARRASSRPPSPQAITNEHDSVPVEQDDDAPEVEEREVELASTTRKRGRQLTLLDGTTIKMPAKKRTAGRRRSDPSPIDDLTAADLLAALRAAAHGVDSGDILGESLRWEKAMAAVLSLLLRKHLILERELLDELKKI